MSATNHVDTQPRITGYGAISAAGTSVARTLQQFAQGKGLAKKAQLLNSPLTPPLFEVSSLPLPTNNTMRTRQLALHAVREAMQCAQLIAPLTGKRVGVCLGTTVACQLNDLAFLTQYRETGKASMVPVNRYLNGNLAETIALETGAQGPHCTITNACASGTDAIGMATSWLKADICDIVIAGGADELNRVPIAGFNALGILSPEQCKPFDKDRQGLNLGEGAGILILETPQSAKNRGIETNLSIASYATASDAYHLTAPHPDAKFLKEAIQTALINAHITPNQITFINAHGTATTNNDHVEGNALASIFGLDTPILSTKGYTGHTLGAAGGLEAVFATLALRDQWLPLCAGFQEKDPDILITPITERISIKGNYALSTSLAFGGGNAALIIARSPS